MKTRAEPEPEGPKYPRLMIEKHTEDIVFFVNQYTGFVIHSGGTATSDQAGRFSTSWNDTLDGWETYKGTVTVSNS